MANNAPAEKEDDDEYKKQHHLMMVEFLARQIKDAALFEATRISSRGELSTASYLDISRVYFEQGDIEAATTRLTHLRDFFHPKPLIVR
jgi:hypothetical protein